jgi:hypothetical protein
MAYLFPSVSDFRTKFPEFVDLTDDQINALLNETAASMQEQDVDSLSFTSDNINPTAFFQPKEASIGDINTMLATARPSSDISMVQINEVPDYSGLMKNLMDKGAI